MDGLIEQPFASALHGFAVARVLFDVGVCAEFMQKITT
jgi:hypothetical protein